MSKLTEILNNVVNFYEDAKDVDHMTIEEAEQAINAYIAEIIDDAIPDTMTGGLYPREIREALRKRAGL